MQERLSRSSKNDGAVVKGNFNFSLFTSQTGYNILTNSMINIFVALASNLNYF
jgi:hypothetical protein